MAMSGWQEGYVVISLSLGFTYSVWPGEKTKTMSDTLGALICGFLWPLALIPLTIFGLRIWLNWGKKKAP